MNTQSRFHGSTLGFLPRIPNADLRQARPREPHRPAHGQRFNHDGPRSQHNPEQRYGQHPEHRELREHHESRIRSQHILPHITLGTRNPLTPAYQPRNIRQDTSQPRHRTLATLWPGPRQVQRSLAVPYLRHSPPHRSTRHRIPGQPSIPRPHHQKPPRNRQDQWRLPDVPVNIASGSSRQEARMAPMVRTAQEGRTTPETLALRTTTLDGNTTPERRMTQEPHQLKINLTTSRGRSGGTTQELEQGQGQSEGVQQEEDQSNEPRYHDTQPDDGNRTKLPTTLPSGTTAVYLPATAGMVPGAFPDDLASQSSSNDWEVIFTPDSSDSGDFDEYGM